MILLSKVIDALEMTNEEIEFYYNPNTKEIFASNIGECNNLTAEELEELFDISIKLPTRYDINEYQMMQDFIETINDKILYNQLLISINGSGAFRRFKDTCINFGIINNWYKFREEKYKETAIEWCNNHNIEFKDN